jgi:prepilin-type N-terminal cleavage/methylation domain-containing protein
MNVPLRGRKEDGFTLLEVLVTLVILAVGLSLTLSLISGAMRNIRRSQLKTRTVQHAETVLELTLLDDTIKHSTSLRGDFEDGTRWEVAVTEIETPVPLQQKLGQRIELPVKMFQYSVAVVAPDSQTPDLVLQTLKVVNVVQQPGPPRLNR